jgi:hypothetical protein
MKSSVYEWQWWGVDSFNVPTTATKNKNIHQLVECQVQVNFSCSFFFVKKYELMENPLKIVVLSSQIYEALRFGFNGFFFSL